MIEYDYKSEEDLLKAHLIMMKGFEDDNGIYRNHEEGIIRDGLIIKVKIDDKDLGRKDNYEKYQNYKK